MNQRHDWADHHHGIASDQQSCRRIFYLVCAFVLLVIIGGCITWGALDLSKPTFDLENLNVYQFNLTAAASPENALTTVMQPTIVSHNPSPHVGIYYDRLEVSLTYQSEPLIDGGTAQMPPLYQVKKGDVFWSPYLAGNSVPMGPSLMEALMRDKDAGLIVLAVKLDCRIRWQVATWRFGSYRLHVDCPAFLASTGFGGGLKLQQSSQCRVSTGQHAPAAADNIPAL